MLSRTRAKKTEAKTIDKEFKNYREYLRYKQSLLQDTDNKESEKKCKEFRRQYIRGEISKEEYINNCKSFICYWHQDGIEPWSGENYLEKYPELERLEELDSELNKLKHKLNSEKDKLSIYIELEGVPQKLKKLQEKINSEKIPLKKDLYKLKELQYKITKNSDTLQNIDTLKDKTIQTIQEYETILENFIQQNKNEIASLKDREKEINREGDKVCKMQSPVVDYDNSSWIAKDQTQEQQCLHMLYDGNLSDSKVSECIPEICEKFSSKPSSHPLSGKEIAFGEKAYNDILNLCDDYFKFLYNTPANIVIPTKVKELPITNNVEFSIKPFQKTSASILDYKFFPEGIYSKGSGSAFSIFSVLYIYLKHHQLLCLPFLMNQKLTKTEIHTDDFTNFSKYLLTWNMKTISKYPAVLNAVKKYTKYIGGDSYNQNTDPDPKSLLATDIELKGLVHKDYFQESEILQSIKDFNCDFIDNSAREKFLQELKEIQEFPTVLKNTLYFNPEIMEQIKQCILSKKKRFVYINLSIQAGNEGHSNVILYDSETKILERFDPLGSKHRGVWSSEDNKVSIELDEPSMDNAIFNLFTENGLEIDRYLTPIQFCPNIGIQIKASPKKYDFEPEGYCSVWATIYVDARLTFPNIPPNILIQKMIDQLDNSTREKKGIISKFLEKVLIGQPVETDNFKKFVMDYANYLKRIQYHAAHIYGSFIGNELTVKKYLELIYSAMKDFSD